MELSSMSILDILQKGSIDGCSCGRRHQTQLAYLELGPGAIARLPDLLRRAGLERPFLVSDPNTQKAAGEQARLLLKDAGIPFEALVLREGRPEPDEAALGELCMRFDASCDCILAVGSGVINDLCKMLAAAVGKRSILIATAPSMDGFASASGSMIVGGVKVSLPCPCPIGVIADTQIMAAAPMRMLQAGLGDALAKYISICEWRISHLVTGEYYCPEIAQMVRNSLKRTVAQADKLLARDLDAVGNVAEALILSGIAMSFAGLSRPASGIEHYFSHMWEMLALQQGQECDLHGIQVGVGTLLAARLYEWIRQVRPDKLRAQEHMRCFSQAAWEAEMPSYFGSAAGEIIAAEKRLHKNDPQKHAQRLCRIMEHWGEILNIIEQEVPSYSFIYNTMHQAQMPLLSGDLGISARQVKSAFLGTREIRDKYVASSLLWDLGLEKEFAKRLEQSVLAEQESKKRAGKK